MHTGGQMTTCSHITVRIPPRARTFVVYPCRIESSAFGINRPKSFGEFCVVFVREHLAAHIETPCFVMRGCAQRGGCDVGRARCVCAGCLEQSVPRVSMADWGQRQIVKIDCPCVVIVPCLVQEQEALGAAVKLLFCFVWFMYE